MSLYTDLGGDAAVTAALDLFYEKVLADPDLSGFFDGVDIGRVKGHQRAFLAMAFGGPQDYRGRDLRTAHQRPRSLGLDEARFDAFMGHFRDTLAELGAPPDKIEEVMSIAYTGQDDVLGR